MAEADDFSRPAASLEMLKLRALLRRKARRFFDKRGFLEVETPILSRDTVVDRYLEPLSAVLFSDPTAPSRGDVYYLQTSPEFAMKRLLAAGVGPIYQFAHAFRAGERGALHNPEFTLLEWYRPGDDMSAGMQLLSEVCEALLGLPAAEQVSYRDAFVQLAGVDPLTAEDDELAALARSRSLGEADDRDGWLNLLLAELVEPHLGVSRPTILFGYPASQAALARLSDGEPAVAERFELYVRGVELANGYHELADAAVLRRRSGQTNRLRAAEGKRVLPEESRLLEAMEQGLPDCSGVALGFDRLVMLAAGARRIDEVLAFPIERA